MNTFCAQCGNSLTADDKFCRACGRTVDGGGPAIMTSGPPPVPAGPPQNSSKAILSLVCGLLIFVPLAFIGAIVFGHMALSEIKKSAGRLKGEGFLCLKDGLLRRTLLEQGDAKVGMRLCVGGIDLHGLIIFGDGFLRPPLLA